MWTAFDHASRGAGVGVGEHELGVVEGRAVGLAFMVVGFKQAAAFQEAFDALVELLGDASDVLVLGWRDRCEGELVTGMTSTLVAPLPVGT